MRIVLDLTDAPHDHIEGTANWADNGQPVAFSGWLALMRLVENAQRRDDDATAPTPTVDRPPGTGQWTTTTMTPRRDDRGGQRIGGPPAARPTDQQRRTDEHHPATLVVPGTTTQPKS